MKNVDIYQSAIVTNRVYNINGRCFYGVEPGLVIKAGQEGRLFVVRSTGPRVETVRVVADSAEAATAAVVTTRGPEWTHECVGSISIVPDPEWYGDWAPIVGALVGIEDLDARIGQCLSQGTTAEQAWLGRALRAMGARGKEIVIEAITMRGRTESEWLARIAVEITPFCAPADAVFIKRRSELDPSAFGQAASVAPLDGVAEHIARAQVAAGLVAPFPACQAGGWAVVWAMPDGGRMVTLDGKLVRAPEGLKETWDYMVCKITRDVHECGLEWARKYRADSFEE